MRKMWSKNQIIKNLENENVVAKTLEQTEPNWKIDINSFGKLGTLTPEVIYGRVQIVNQMMYFIFSLKYSNDTASDVSAYGTSNDFTFELPEDVASKIFDVNGDSVADQGEEGTYIASTYSYASRSNKLDASKFTGRPRLTLFNTPVANKIGVLFNTDSSITAPANGFCIIEGRIELSLI